MSDLGALPTLDEELAHIDREMAWFRADQRYTPAKEQAIILTKDGREIGAAYGLENVYRAYEFLPYDQWHYERGDR